MSENFPIIVRDELNQGRVSPNYPLFTITVTFFCLCGSKLCSGEFKQTLGFCKLKEIPAKLYEGLSSNKRFGCWNSSVGSPSGTLSCLMQRPGFDPPLGRIFFPLELTWVLTPFPPNSVG